MQRTRAIELFEEYMQSAIERDMRAEDVVLLMIGELHRTGMQRRAGAIGEVIDCRGLPDFDWYGSPPVMDAGTGEFLGSYKKVTGNIM